MADYYELLGISRNATSAEVRKAYMALARDRHPDRFSDPLEKERAQEFFKDVTAAFNALSNDRQREEYNRSLEKPRATSPEDLAREAFTEAQSLAQVGNLAEALDRYRAAVHHAPGEVKYQAALARLLARSSQTAHEAVETFERAIKLQPRGVALYIELANLLLRLGLRIRAKKVAEAALQMAPADAQVQSLAADLDLLDPDPPKGGFLRRKS